MKNKIFVFIGITILFSCFFTVKAHAQTLNQLSSNSKFMVYCKHETSTPGTYYYYIYTVPSSIGHDEVNLYINNSSIYALPNNSAYSWINKYWILNEDPLLELNKNYNVLTSDTQRSFSYTSSDLIIVLKGDVNLSTTNSNVFGSLDDYNESIAPTWWEKLYDWFGDLYQDIADIMPDDPIWQWIWSQDGENINNPEIVVPTLAPTPTQIPYQTVIVPVRDPSTGDIISYNYEYHYNNPSGTPIAATAPPEQPERNPTGPGSSDNYNPQDPLAIPTGINWINPGFNAGAYQDEFSNPLGTLSDGLNMISYSFTSASGEYTQGVSGISQSFQFIPSSWFMLIGMGAAIIILAGIINRFLG